MPLWELPPELAQLVAAFLTLADVVALTGCAASPVGATRLRHFLPSADALDGFVANTKSRLRSNRRKHPTHAATHPNEGSVSGYEDDCVRRLLLGHDCYARLAPLKLDATEALRRRLSGVALEILEAQRRRRQLNRFSLSKTLALALRQSDHAVVDWILELGVGRLPRSRLRDVALACCEYNEQDGGHEKTTTLMASLLHAISRCDCDLPSLLVAAARFNKRSIVDLVLGEIVSEATLSANVVEDAMVAAAEGGSTQILLTLIHLASTTSVRGPLKASAALVKACEGGRIDVVHALLNSAQLAFSSDSAGLSDTPMLAAAKGCSCEVLRAVLSDQRVNQWDPRAIQHAACCGQREMVQSLVRHAECRPQDIQLALRAAVATMRTSQPVDQTATTDVLLGLLTRLQVDSGSSWELLDLVCSYGNVELVELLLAKFPSSEQCSDRKYWRPLVAAARRGHAEVVRLIIQAEGVWMLLSIQHSTDAESEFAEALLGACHRGHLEAAKLLLPHVGLEMMQLLRIVEAAASAPTCAVLEWLLRTEKITSQHGAVAGYDLDAALQYACAHGRTASARVLLEHPGVRFENGLPIQFAATSGELELVDLLLADPRVTEAYDLEGALIDASREGHVRVVARLLSDTRLRVTTGAAHHEAAHYGKREVLEMLLRQPELDTDTLDLEAAYMRAAQRGHYAIVFLLLNDSRVRLPRDGAITRVEDLPKKAGDTAWSRRFLRRFFRHPRVDPTADNQQLLLDACLQARCGVVDALLRSTRVSVTETLVETVEALALLSEQANRPQYGGRKEQLRRGRRYKLLAASLRQYQARHGKAPKPPRAPLQLLVQGPE